MTQAVLVALLGFSFGARGQSTVTIPAEYDKLIKSRTSVASLGAGLFGDEVNLYDGALQFRQNDVSLPGNNRLAVSVTRSFKVKQDEHVEGLFADWELDIPHLHGVFANNYEWSVPVPPGQPSSAAYLRCSAYGPPQGVITYGNGLFAPGEFWAGSFLTLPGGGGGEILKRGSSIPAPSDGQTYPLLTRDGVVFRCLSSLAATSSGSGEGFEAMTPEGIRYRFDQMAVRLAPNLFKEEPFPQTESLTDTGQAQAVSGPVPLAPSGYMMNRREVWIMPTLVTDRYGNTVTYTWSSDDPWKLLSISASDGRTLTFNYVTGTHRISSISDGTHTWNYTYASTAAGGRLSQVTLPDSSKWTFQLEPLRTVMSSIDGAGCGSAGDGYPGSGNGTITHPSGAQGSFSVASTVHGRSHVWPDCRNYDPANSPGYSYYPAEFLVASLTQKTLTGPGMPSQTWNYSYGPANNCYEPTSNTSQWPAGVGVQCTPSSPTTKIASVTAPDGVVTRYTFGNRFQVDEGQLLQVDEDWKGSSAVRTTLNSYAPANAGPYPNPVGYTIHPRNDGYMGSRFIPVKTKTITQQGYRFTWQVDATCGSGTTLCFDTFARPTKVMKASAPVP